MDRHYRILKRVIFELPPLTDETPEETALRQQLTTEVKETRARRDSVDPQRLGVGRLASSAASNRVESMTQSLILRLHTDSARL